MTAPDHATTDSLTAVDEQADPRLARSRNRLLDAAAPNFGGGVLTCPSRRSRTKVVAGAPARGHNCRSTCLQSGKSRFPCGAVTSEKDDHARAHAHAHTAGITPRFGCKVPTSTRIPPLITPLR